MRASPGIAGRMLPGGVGGVVGIAGRASLGMGVEASAGREGMGAVVVRVDVEVALAEKKAANSGLPYWSRVRWMISRMV